jgi:hypothetical protein
MGVAGIQSTSSSGRPVETTATPSEGPPTNRMWKRVEFIEVLLKGKLGASMRRANQLVASNAVARLQKSTDSR